MKVFIDNVGFTEGPVVCQDGSIAATAIDRGEISRTVNGKASVLATTGGGPNGLVEAGDGSFYLCQNGGVWPALNHIKREPGVQKIAKDGTVDYVAKGMVAPNDLAFGPDGLLYVTDPTRKPERDDGRVWRLNVESGQCDKILHVDWYPNGIGFGPDDDTIVLADTGRRRLVAVPRKDPAPEKARTLFTMTVGMPDGFAYDAEGNVVVAAVGVKEDEPGTVQVWSPAGKCLEVIELKRTRFITNVAISPDKKLYVCDSGNSCLLVRDWPAAGLPLHPFR